MSSGAIAGLVIGIGILCLLCGFIGGWFLARKIIKNQLKKNPPISKETIRMIYTQVGRKPTEQQINEIYNKAVKIK
ncbi:MAG: YneF family protein [Ureaplasma sp.]|nr:YneF family protein [Ureaplasma sp.]